MGGDGCYSHRHSLDVIRMNSDYHRVVEALRTYAAVQPLNLLKPGQIQDDLRAIAGDRHTHRRSIGSDRCLICRRDLCDPIHQETAK